MFIVLISYTSAAALIQTNMGKSWGQSCIPLDSVRQNAYPDDISVLCMLLKFEQVMHITSPDNKDTDKRKDGHVFTLQC